MDAGNKIVKCERCGWEGSYLDDPYYNHNGYLTSLGNACPMCMSDRIYIKIKGNKDD